jgi:hypothetical protein
MSWTAAAIHSTVILRSRALARRLEGWPRAFVAHPSRLAVKNGEHLRMTAVGERPAMTKRISSSVLLDKSTG